MTFNESIWNLRIDVTVPLLKMAMWPTVVQTRLNHCLRSAATEWKLRREAHVLPSACVGSVFSARSSRFHARCFFAKALPHIKRLVAIREHIELVGYGNVLRTGATETHIVV